MIGALTYEEVLRATMRSNWIHALWLFAVVVLIWVCTILLTLHNNRKKKPKGKDDSWQVSAKKRHALACRFTRRSLSNSRTRNAKQGKDRACRHPFHKCHGTHGESPSGDGLPRSDFRSSPSVSAKRNTSRLAGVSFWRRHPDLNRGSRICSPMPYHLAMAPKIGAGNEIRTRYLHLGKVALCQMSYARKMVPPVGIEPTTRGFSVPCSTN